MNDLMIKNLMMKNLMLDNETIIDQFNEGKQLNFLFFWGHTPKDEAQVDKSCFSQWFPRAFEHEGNTYETAEHWMMAGKAKLFEDQEMLERILNCKTAPEAKKLGRKVRNFDPVVWNEHKRAIVLEGNILKFGQHNDFKEYLISTGDQVLVEASPYDAIWGIGMSANSKGVENPKNWKGENLLGYVLMDTRTELTK